MINILAACDANYVQHLGVMLVSLLEHNAAERFRVFVLTSVTAAEMAKVAASCAGYRCEIVPVSIDPGRLDGVPVYGHVTRAGYYRLLLGDVLPPDVSRVLYLDSDILIAGSIAELWNRDLGGNIVAAVADEVGAPPKLKLPAGETYFNSGVMVIDLEQWRRERVGEAALAFARDEPHRITWWDQCALNFVLRGRWLRLDRKWNLQTLALGRFTQYDVVSTAEGRQRLADAVVIHFTTNAKPWLYLCGHPAKAAYWRYLRKTPWRDYRVPDLSARNVTRRLLLRYCPWLINAYRSAQGRAR